jgi:O-antigen ligase
VTVFAALTGPLPKVGVVVVALLAASAMLAGDARNRTAATLGALVLAPILLLADIWHSPQLHVVHHHPLLAIVAAAAGLALVGALAFAIVRRPPLLPLLIVITLPFRIPIQAGGTTSNLLVPLYLVVASGSLALIYSTLRAEQPPRRAHPGWIERMLALYVVIYALQSIYSSDFEKAMQQMVFFYVPFSLLLCLLRQIDWTPRLIRICFLVLIGLALVFTAVGFAEYETKTLFLNPKLVAANEVHAYFTVNSVFFDPDIFGRFLALVMIAVAVVLLYRSERREIIGATVILAILWAGLVLTLSRSSLAALLVGLGVLAALRWKSWPVVAVGAVVVVVGAAAVAIHPKTFGLNQGLNGASSGRAGLVSGGFDLFRDRPLWGYGSGSFVREYRRHHPGSSQTLSASHTIPITIAAEQGLIGEAVYVALVVFSLIGLLRVARGSPARAAVAAAFVALVFHTMLYADFLEDPFTWSLLGLGIALAAQARPGRRPSRRAAGPVAPATA